MIGPVDEYLHAAPDPKKGLFSDNFWLSICDREADVFGVNHIFASTNRGYGRFSTCLVIDGTQMPWANKWPISTDLKSGVVTEGHMTYSVVEPEKHIRLTFDGPKYGFDLLYTGRFPAFDYADCIGGNPLSAVGHFGGHYEQGMHCTGDFEVRSGPRQGLRRIDSYAHRDHSWGYRFNQDSPWELPTPTRQESLIGFWPAVQTDTFHLNSFGWFNPKVPTNIGFGSDANSAAPMIGGFLSDKHGSRPILGTSAVIRLENDGRTAMSFRFMFKLPGGEVIHVRTGRKYAQTVNGLMRGEDDVECRVDAYEGFFDFEVEETGERGYGHTEFSISPPSPRFRY